MPVELTPAPQPPEDDAGPSGYYWSWKGIRGVLGDSNAVENSWLDQTLRTNPTDADFVRIGEIGIEADAWTNFRVRNGVKKYTPPIPTSSADFPLIQRATNLYAAFQLVRSRIWFSGDIDDDTRARAQLSLRKQADDLYTALFDGTSEIDGATSTTPPKTPAGTWTSVPLRFDDTWP